MCRLHHSEDERGNVKRDVVHGPTVFIPDVNQWLHVFRWHGSKGDDQYTKIPGVLVFTKLRTIPDQFYYNALVGVWGAWSWCMVCSVDSWVAGWLGGLGKVGVWAAGNR